MHLCVREQLLNRHPNHYATGFRGLRDGFERPEISLFFAQSRLGHFKRFRPERFPAFLATDVKPGVVSRSPMLDEFCTLVLTHE